MKKIINYLMIAGMCTVAFFNTGCKKEYITEEHITQEYITQQYLNLDSMKIVKGLLAGKWVAQNNQSETYAGTSMVSKTIEFFPAKNTTVELRSDSTYTNVDKGNIAGSGTWKLLSPSYLSFDLGNASQERYYFIKALDGKVLIVYGPFKKDGSFFFGNTINTAYYMK